MTFEKFIRTRKSIDEPVISIYGNRIHYSVHLVKLAELKNYSFVTYYINENERKIAFEFSKEDTDDNSYALENRNNKIWRSTANELVARYPWIRKVAELKDKNMLKFIAKKREARWVIQLCPAFEYRIPKNEVDKVGEAKGIYRYLLDEKVVYIGRGEIKKRACDSERKDWEYDTIEYSILDNEEQSNWECFWIEKYKEANLRLLPYYNKISGSKSS